MEVETRVRVFRAKGKEIETVAYCTSEGEIGADMPLDEFLKAITQVYGNVASTMTAKKHEEKLLAAAVEVVEQMKKTTVAVASINFNKIKRANPTPSSQIL
jgi:hypothetical protein